MKFTLKKILSAMLLLVSGVVPLTNAREIEDAHGYIGRKIYIDSTEYKSRYSFGFLISRKYNDGSASQPYLDVTVFAKSRLNNAVLLLAEGHHNSYRVVDWVDVHDAVEIPNGLQLIVGNSQELCEAKKYPLDTILAIGKWVNRKAKNGDYAGGYARPIRKAWRVDFSTKKLIEIPTDSVSCEDNTQPGEID